VTGDDEKNDAKDFVRETNVEDAGGFASVVGALRLRRTSPCGDTEVLRLLNSIISGQRIYPPEAECPDHDHSPSRTETTPGQRSRRSACLNNGDRSMHGIIPNPSIGATARIGYPARKYPTTEKKYPAHR
jgi:hypothetical protein